ncbi:MAG: cupredoxin domain-containing protein [Chloroflexota bacterium]
MNKPLLFAASAGRSLLPALAVLALALVVAACGSGGAGAGSSPVPTTTVDLPTSYRFAPAAIVVPAGSTVTWINHDNFTHNVSLEGQAPLTMAPGESVSHTFATPGLYRYICSLHPKDMKGSVLVTGP